MGELYGIIGAVIGLFMVVGGAYFKGLKDKGAAVKIEEQHARLKAKAKEATLSADIQKNNEEIDRLSDSDVDYRLRDDFRADSDL